MSDKKLAICTTINNKYADYAVVCLQSFRRNSGLNSDLFVFVNQKHLNQAQINNFKNNDINIINVDFSQKYNIPKDWSYPSECFWIFECPKILYSLGYDYTLCVDTDTYCNALLNLEFIDNIEFVAGINRGKTNKEFLNAIKQLKLLTDLFDLSQDRLNLYSTNTGILIFNNKYCYDTNFEEKIYQVFKKSMDNNIPRKGDDSLFCLYCCVFDTPITYISNKFNDYNLNEIKNEEPYIIHYISSSKPWINDLSIVNSINKYYINKWINFKNNINNGTIKI